MRNLLLLLLLTNILYFVWGMFADDPVEPGIAIVSESELGPPLAVSTNRGSEAAASVGAVLGSGEPSALAAVVGRSCVSIGPFQARTDADAALTRYAGEGMRTSLRSAQGMELSLYQVEIGDIVDLATGNAMIEKLHEGGLTDAYLVESEDAGRRILLGLFGQLDGAEKIELQAKSLDFPAQITPKTMTREGTVFFVDIGLSPGKGAGAMIEKYGEEKVLLRGDATCPLSP